MVKALHILFLTDNFPPEVNAPASRTYEHACEWVKLGHKVTIITCAPNFPNGRVFDGYRNKLWSVEVIDGINVIRVWTYIAPNSGFFRRLIDFLSFMISAFIASFFIRNIDLVIGTSPQFFTVVSAWLVSILRRVQFIFELRDLWPASIETVGAVRSKIILGILRSLEKFMYHRADAIIAVTHSFKNELVKRGIEPKKIFVVTNGVDITRFLPKPKNEALLKKFELKDKFVVGYIGTIGMAHRLETLLEVADLIQRDPELIHIHIILIGDGAERNKLKLLSTKRNLKNVSFLNSVSKTEICDYWSMLDLSVVHLKNDDLFNTVIPSKIFESMAMGIPILHAVKGESADIIAQTGSGILAEPENAVSIYNVIRKICFDKFTLDQMARNGKNAAKGYNRRSLALKMIEIFKLIYDLNKKL